MQYGSFVEDGKGFLVNTPKTPVKWNNFLFNDEYFTEVSQTLQGASSIVTGYVKKAFTEGYRFFYIRDQESDEIWRPNKGGGDYFSCLYKPYDMTLCSSENDIETELRVFVPVKGTHEIWTVEARNSGDTERRLSLFIALGISDESPMGAECKYEEDNFIYKRSFPYHVFYDEKEKVIKNHSYFYVIPNIVPTSYDLSRRRFFGSDEIGDLPVAVRNGKCSKIIAEAEEYCAALHYDICLNAGEKVLLSFAIGGAVTFEEVKKFNEKFNAAYVNEEHQKAVQYWGNIYQNFTVKTPNNDFNALTNYWLKKQSVLLTRLNRMGTYCPIRNQLQDAMGYCMIEPDEAEKFMMNVICRQQRNGFIKQWYMTDNSAPRDLCLINHSDGPLWVVMALSFLVHQQGNRDLLEKDIPYIDGGSDTLYQHLLNAIFYMFSQVGRHGLCLMKDGDWTDPINGAGRLGYGESTWNSLALIYCADCLLELAWYMEDKENISVLYNLKLKMETAVNDYCWDEEWYITGFDDYGKPYGDKKTEDRIFLNAQTWAVITGTAKDERLERLLNSLKRLDTSFGPLLLDPSFSDWDARWGRISIKKSGTTENGSVYCHASMFKAYADAKRGDGDALFDTLLKTLPINPFNPTEANLQLPLYVPNYYYATKGSPNYGRSSCNFGTGTVGWMLILIVEELFGIKATMNGLTLQPHFPDSWDEAYCERYYRGSMYKIKYRKGTRNEIFVDDVPCFSVYLPWENGKTYEVEVFYNSKIAD